MIAMFRRFLAMIPSRLGSPNREGYLMSGARRFRGGSDSYGFETENAESGISTFCFTSSA
jgi:hypothetical protein